MFRSAFVSASLCALLCLGVFTFLCWTSMSPLVLIALGAMLTAALTTIIFLFTANTSRQASGLERELESSRLISKGQACFVPLRMLARPSATKPHAVLIDDDPLVCAGWELSAKSAGKELIAFRDSRSFLDALPGLPPTVPIFIDSQLGEDERGESLARRLYDRGFSELYLVTGYPASFFEPMPWLKGILEKDPPRWLFSGA